MLLGREFSILSQLPLYYIRHQDGCFRFSVNSYKSNFDDPSLKYLNHLCDLSIAKIDRDFIEVSSVEWIKLFINKLNKLFYTVDPKTKVSFRDKDTITFEHNSLKIVDFKVNFNIEGENIIQENLIHFCDIYLTNEYCLNWLDILNDELLVEHLYAYLQKKFTSFKYKNLRTLDFLNGIESEYLNQIFHIVIPDFLEKKGYMVIRNVHSDIFQIFKNFIHKDHIEILEVIKTDVNQNFYFTKFDNQISFFNILDDDIISFSNDEINELEKKLLKKRDIFSKLTLLNKHQTFNIADKSIKNAWFFISLINAVLLYGNTVGIKSFKSITSSSYVLYSVSIALVILTILTFLFYTLPAIKISLFKWTLKK